MGPEEFDEEDRWLPKHPHWWVFPPDPVTQRIEGNARAVFEVVRLDPTIRKIVLTEDAGTGFEGENVTVHPVGAPRRSSTCCALDRSSSRAGRDATSTTRCRVTCTSTCYSDEEALSSRSARPCR